MTRRRRAPPARAAAKTRERSVAEGAWWSRAKVRPTTRAPASESVAANAAGLPMPAQAWTGTPTRSDSGRRRPPASTSPSARVRAVARSARGARARTSSRSRWRAGASRRSERVITIAWARPRAERGSRSSPRGRRRPKPNGFVASRRTTSTSRARRRCWNPSSSSTRSIVGCAGEEGPPAPQAVGVLDLRQAAVEQLDQQPALVGEAARPRRGPVAPGEEAGTAAARQRTTGEPGDERRLARAAGGDVADADRAHAERPRGEEAAVVAEPSQSRPGREAEGEGREARSSHGARGAPPTGLDVGESHASDRTRPANGPVAFSPARARPGAASPAAKENGRGRSASPVDVDFPGTARVSAGSSAACPASGGRRLRSRRSSSARCPATCRPSGTRPSRSRRACRPS